MKAEGKGCGDTRETLWTGSMRESASAIRAVVASIKTIAVLVA